MALVHSWKMITLALPNSSYKQFVYSMLSTWTCKKKPTTLSDKYYTIDSSSLVLCEANPYQKPTYNAKDIRLYRPFHRCLAR
jgi:hypothetical protein